MNQSNQTKILHYQPQLITLIICKPVQVLQTDCKTVRSKGEIEPRKAAEI